MKIKNNIKLYIKIYVHKVTDKCFKKPYLFIKDVLEFGKSVGYIFAFKYKTGLAKEGKDFY